MYSFDWSRIVATEKAGKLKTCISYRGLAGLDICVISSGAYLFQLEDRYLKRLTVVCFMVEGTRFSVALGVWYAKLND